MNDMTITEDDLRMPEFRGVSIDQLERRADGAIVRKDRWELVVREIAGLFYGARGSFETSDVVNACTDASRAEAALLNTFDALVKAQSELKDRLRSQEFEVPGEAITIEETLARRYIRGRFDAITAALSILSDAAGKAGYAIK